MNIAILLVLTYSYIRDKQKTRTALIKSWKAFINLLPALAGVMINEGDKFSNAIILLGAGSTMKIQMFLFEITSLGSAFAITRWVISLIAILVMGLLISKIVSVEEKEAVYKLHAS